MIRDKLIIVLSAFILFANITEGKFYSKAIARERLISDLFMNYNSQLRPTSANNKTLYIGVNIKLQHFDFRETDGALKFIGLLNAEWTDRKLAWKPSDYNNITEMSVSQRLIWMPDLELYNNAPDKFLRMHRNGGVVLNYNGSLTWSDAIEATIFCTTNMLKWPHDHHICNLTFGSWTYDGFEIDIIIDKNAGLTLDNETKNLLYNVINYNAEHILTNYEQVEEPYVTILYHIEIERASGYAILFRMPAIVIILLTLMALMIEPNRSQKISLYGLCLILITFQLIYFASKTGQFARETPLIVTFYSCCFVMVTLANLLCTFCLWLIHAGPNKLPQRVSIWLRNPFTNFLIPLNTGDIGNSSIQYENADFSEHFEEVTLNTDHSKLLDNGIESCERFYLAKVLERVFLITYSFIFLIIFSVCYV